MSETLNQAKIVAKVETVSNMVRVLLGLGFGVGVWATTLQFRIGSLETRSVESTSASKTMSEWQRGVDIRLERMEAIQGAMETRQRETSAKIDKIADKIGVL